MVTSWIANDAGHNQSVDVSYFAQTPDGQRGKQIIIDTRSQRVRSTFQLAEPEPVRVSVANGVAFVRNVRVRDSTHALVSG